MTDHPPQPPPPPPHGEGSQPPYPYAGQQPPAQSRGRGCGRAALIGLAVVGGLVVLLVIVSVIAVGTADDDNGDQADTGVRTESRNTENPPQDDVVIDSCEASQGLNFATAKGTITNHSSETSNYVIEVNITDEAGTVLGNTGSVVNNVPAGGTALFEAPSTVEMAPGVSCELTDVNRFAS
jgi:hypothetical protein